MNLITLLLTSSTSFAATQAYEMKVEFSINGQVVSSPKIHTLDGESTTVTQKNEYNVETFVEVTATEGQGGIKDNKAILMKFKIGTIENGERKVLAEPQIMTIENKKAEISITNLKEDKAHVSLSVIAERE